MFYSVWPEQAVEQTVQLSEICGVMALMWCDCNEWLYVVVSMNPILAYPIYKANFHHNKSDTTYVQALYSLGGDLLIFITQISLYATQLEKPTNIPYRTVYVTRFLKITRISKSLFWWFHVWTIISPLRCLKYRGLSTHQISICPRVVLYFMDLRGSMLGGRKLRRGTSIDSRQFIN